MNNFEIAWQSRLWRAKMLWKLFPRQQDPSFIRRVLLPAVLVGLVFSIVAFGVCHNTGAEHDTFLMAMSLGFLFGFGGSGFTLLPSFTRLTVAQQNKNWELFTKKYPDEAFLLENQRSSRHVMAITLFWSYN